MSRKEAPVWMSAAEKMASLPQFRVWDIGFSLGGAGLHFQPQSPINIIPGRCGWEVWGFSPTEPPLWGRNSTPGVQELRTSGYYCSPCRSSLIRWRLHVGRGEQNAKGFRPQSETSAQRAALAWGQWGRGSVLWERQPGPYPPSSP